MKNGWLLTRTHELSSLSRAPYRLINDNSRKSSIIINSHTFVWSCTTYEMCRLGVGWGSGWSEQPFPLVSLHVSTSLYVAWNTPKRCCSNMLKCHALSCYCFSMACKCIAFWPKNDINRWWGWAGAVRGRSQYSKYDNMQAIPTLSTYSARICTTEVLQPDAPTRATVCRSLPTAKFKVAACLEHFSREIEKCGCSV